MAAQTSAEEQQGARIADLEDRLGAAIDVLGEELAALELRVRRVEGEPQVPHPLPPQRRRGQAAPAARPAAAFARREGQLGDVIGGTVLAWVGGLATLLGIALFLALAISHGWIGEQGRVLIAAATSLGLLAAGVRLHARRGRTEAAVATAGAGIAGMFATLVVAGAVYGLVPGLLALAGAMAVGATATALAIRWAGRPLAGLGLIGALAAPALVGAPSEWPTLAMMLAAAGCAMWVAARQRWSWLSLAVVVVCAPQWALPMLEGQTAGEDLAVLAAFATLGLAGAAASARTRDGERAALAAVAALTISAATSAIVGRAALAAVAGAGAGAAWLAVLALAHIGLGAAPRAELGPRLRAVLVGLGVALADAAFALTFHGVALAIGWSAGAALLAASTRRVRTDGPAAPLRDLGLGAQVSLALVRVLLDAPPGALLAGSPQPGGVASLLALATGSLAAAGLIAERAPLARRLLGAAGVAALAYLTAYTLDGPALALAWAGEAGALLAVARRDGGRLAHVAWRAFAAAAAGYTLLALAPPSGLAGDGVDLAAAAPALLALAALAWRAGRPGRSGPPAHATAKVAPAAPVLYLASLAVCTLPEGQVALSALWGVSGVAALLAGLRADVPALRNLALGLLGLTVGKVFLYDLSTLTSIARVVSFLVLGLLLLAGAFAHQRLRPPPRPDLREVHPSRR